MAVKWIGEAARELGMDTLEAISLLASKQSYPYNGLLDEDRVILLKRWREGGRMSESGRISVAPPPPTVPPPPLSLEPPGPAAPPPVPAGTGQSLRKKSDDEPTSKTSPFPTVPSGEPGLPGPLPPPIPGRDKAEERTVILPPVTPE